MMGIWAMAFRYLRSRRIALVAMFSIALGVMAMIVVVSLMDGVESFMKNHLRGTQSDLVASHIDAGSIVTAHFQAVSEALKPYLESSGGEIAGMAPRREVRGLIVPGDKPGPEQEERIKGVFVVGIDWDLERQVTKIESAISSVDSEQLQVPASARDDPFRTDGLPRILLGDSLARVLGVSRIAHPGMPDTVTLITGKPKIGEDGKTSFDHARCTPFQVAGCFSTGQEEYDGLHAYVDRRYLISMLSDHQRPELDASVVYLRFREGVDPERAAERLQRERPSLRFWSWRERNRDQLLALQDQKRIMLVILSFIIGVASVAILGIVYLMVSEKTRDIGILRSMGMERWRLVAVFLLYGLALGVLGSLGGVLLGVQLASHLDAVVGWLSGLLGVPLLDPRVYKFESVPTVIEPWTVVTIAGIALAMSFFASLLPALRAAHLTPVRALRSE